MSRRSLIVVAFFLLSTTVGASMAIGKSLVLCSEFSGKLVNESGDAVAGVRLERKWTWGWNEQSGKDETRSAADGSFRFPAVTGRSFLASLLPHEPSITQEITAHTDSGPLRIWFAGKLNYDPDGELGRPLNMLCYVDREPTSTRNYSGTCEERR